MEISDSLAGSSLSAQDLDPIRSSSYMEPESNSPHSAADPVAVSYRDKLGHS